MIPSDSSCGIVLRKAVSGDVPAIFNLLDVFARQELLLKRTSEDILARIANFSVAVSGETVVGCVALRDFGNGLYEIRSLAVDTNFQKCHIGSQLISFAEKTLDFSEKKAEKSRIFALTYHPNLFVRLGFNVVSKELFPEKIWADCALCPNLLNCQETAVLKEI